MYYSEEERDKLAGWTAFNPGTVENWTPSELKEALPEDKWPLITVDRIDADLQEKISEIFREISKNNELSDAALVKAHTDSVLMVCLKSLKNYRDAEGGELKIERVDGIVPRETVRLIGQQMKTAIYLLIMRGADSEEV